MKHKKAIFLSLVLLSIILIITSCGILTNETKKTPNLSPSPTRELTEAEKQAAEYDRIAQEALDNEHDHVWVFSHYGERHPHYSEYKCECGATKLDGSKTADYKMTIVGKSSEHPHYMLEECSICKNHFVNENLPTELTWILDGYTDEHPHYGKVKCSQCDYYEINEAITAEGRGVSMLISEESIKEHPHYLIVKCTYPGCEHTYIEKNATDEWEYLTDSDNYSIAHPHHLFGVCDYDGCSHETLLDETADWSWDDGVCSICGIAKNFKYTKDDIGTRISGLTDEKFEGNLVVPELIENLSVISIESEAFQNAFGILSVKLPDSLEIIGARAFSGCINLTLEASPSNPINEFFDEIYEVPVSQSFELLVSDLEAGHVPGYMGNNLMIVETESFMGCSSLVTLCFGENLMEIQPFAFDGCSELRHIFFTSPNAPMLSPESFANVSPELRIYVHAEATGYNGPEWEQYEIVYYE